MRVQTLLALFFVYSEAVFGQSNQDINSIIVPITQGIGLLCENHNKYIDELRSRRISTLDLAAEASSAGIIFLGESHEQSDSQRKGYWHFLNALKNISDDFNCLFIEQEPSDFMQKMSSCPKKVDDHSWCNGSGPEFTPAVAFALKHNWRVIPIDKRDNCKNGDVLSIENFRCRNKNMSDIINNEKNCKKSVVINGTGHLFNFFNQGSLSDFIYESRQYKINVTSSSENNSSNTTDLIYHWKDSQGNLVCKNNPPIIEEEWAALHNHSFKNPLVYIDGKFQGDWRDFNASLFLK